MKRETPDDSSRAARRGGWLSRRGLLAAPALALAGLPAVSAAPVELKLFLLAGQSNMAGADSVLPGSDGLLQIESDRATLFTGTPLSGAASADFKPWGSVRGHKAAKPPYGDRPVIGPEVGFERRLYEAGLRNLALIKVWANYPRTETVWPWGEGGALHTRWMNFADERIAELEAAGYVPKVAGFVWHQGIDDAIHGRFAAEYLSHLKQLAADLRRRFRAEGAPFVLARSVNSPIARSITGHGPNDPMAVVRRLQESAAKEIPLCGWVDVDDLPNVVQHHFSADSQLIIGRRFGDLFLKLARAGSESAR